MLKYIIQTIKAEAWKKETISKDLNNLERFMEVREFKMDLDKGQVESVLV